MSKGIQIAGSLIIAAGGVGGFYWLGQHGYLQSRGDSEEKPLSYLALKLESEYRRDMHQNGFSLDYSARSPNTIVIAVSFYASTDRAMLNSVVRAAGENAQGVGRDQFHLPHIKIETEWNELSGTPERSATE